jgi:homocitrate synthase NifV
MLQLVDDTLMAVKGPMPPKEELQGFCELLFTIGVDVIELPIDIYHYMGELPRGRYILNVEYEEEMDTNPGFYRYVCRQPTEAKNVIHELQLNDIREIIKLRTFEHCAEVRIKGLDDLICYPYEKYMKEWQYQLPGTIIHFCPENTFGCATALAFQWIMDFGSNITTSFTGCRNNAATEELIMALRLAIRHKPNRDLTVLPRLSDLYERLFHVVVQNRKPIIGKNIFKVESGIHADGIHKNPVTYEAYAPGCVGAKSELVIGKHSGTRAVKLKLEELKLPIATDYVIDQILHQVRLICTKERKSLSEEEFILLATEVMRCEGSQVYC